MRSIDPAIQRIKRLLFHVTRFPCYLERSEEFDFRFGKEECNDFNLRDATESFDLLFCLRTSENAQLRILFPSPPSRLLCTYLSNRGYQTVRLVLHTRSFRIETDCTRRVFSAFANSCTSSSHSRPTRRLRKTGGDLDDIRKPSPLRRTVLQVSRTHASFEDLLPPFVPFRFPIALLVSIVE